MFINTYFPKLDNTAKQFMLEQLKQTKQLLEENKNLADRNENLDNSLQQQSKLTESKRVYLNQRDFGCCFNTKIGSKTVGKLLKVVGLAMKSYSNTKPYDDKCPKYAQPVLDQYKKVASYKWNYNTCIGLIDSWLRKHGEYEEFYAITNPDKLTDFVNELYIKYL